jgi:hypothetical protein
MGLVVRFPLERARSLPPSPGTGEGAEIVVLPVVRIERDPAAARAPRRRKPARSKRRTRRQA